MSTQLVSDVAASDYNGFEQISNWIPEDSRIKYWKLVSELKSIAPNDDILKIIEMMGVVTVISKQVPTELAAERVKLREEIGSIQDQLKKLTEQVLDQSSKLAVRLEEIQTISDATSTSLDQFSKQVEDTLKSAASKVDVNALSNAFSAELREKTIEPIQQLSRELDGLQKRFSAIIPKVETSVEVLKRARWWIPWVVASTICASISIYSWYRYRDSFNWVGFCQTFQSGVRHHQ